MPQQLLELLVKLWLLLPYVTLATALYAANILLTAGSMIYGYTVVLHISYTYGYTNDGVLGWTPGLCILNEIY